MPSELNPSSQEPLYKQLMDDIKRDIASGLYAPNNKIPSEIELGDIYRVSRITIRRAIKELQQSGVLTKRQGKGTFVNPKHAPERNIESQGFTIGFSETCQANGLVPGARLVTRELVDADPRTSAFFGEAGEGKAVRIVRIRTADGRPLMIEDNLFNPSLFSFFLDVPLDDNSTYDLIKERTGLIPMTLGQTELGMVRASAKQAEMLDVSENESLFQIDGLFVGQGNEPIYVGSQFIVARDYKFRL